MPLELPVFHLGLAGFDEAGQARVRAALDALSPGVAQWRLGRFADADAWWVHGARTAVLQDGTVRVLPATRGGRALQLDMEGVERPLAFARPVASPRLQPAFSFDLDDPAGVRRVLDLFSGWLAPQVAQFYLAEAVLEHHASLGSGCFEVVLEGKLLAVLDRAGEAGVLPSAGPLEFENATWRRCPPGARMPDAFARASFSQLMWQYALRTRLDHLPRHYRAGLLYFRRPPRVPQRLLRDEHLLLMRELAQRPCSFAQLRQLSGLGEARLGQALAALYLAGAITANAGRAAMAAGRRGESPDSVAGPSTVPPAWGAPPLSVPPPLGAMSGEDPTAPAPLRH